MFITFSLYSIPKTHSFNTTALQKKNEQTHVLKTPKNQLAVTCRQTRPKSIELQ